MNNGFGSDFEVYAKELLTRANDNGIACIGITDYFLVDGYKELQALIADDGKLQDLVDDPVAESAKKTLLIPNIEFRSSTIVRKVDEEGQSHDSRVNFHILFADSVLTETIEEDFLRELKFSADGAPATPDEEWPVTRRNLEDLGRRLQDQHPHFQEKSAIFVGMMNAVVNHNDAIKILEGKPSKFRGKYLLGLACDEDLSGVNWNDQGHQTRKLFYQSAHFLFSSNQNTRKFALGHFHGSVASYLEEFKTLKPCLHGSDAHEIGALFAPADELFTWVKADPTFEGLKQVIFEPAERVRIQEPNPQLDYPKTYFSNIKTEGSVFIDERGELPKFSPTEIPLNPNLVALIGGRGAGKSLLLDVMCRTFSSQSDVEGRLEAIGDPEFQTVVTRSDQSELPFSLFEHPNSFEYLHVRQGDVKRIAVDPRRLANEIIELLGGLDEFSDPVFEEQEQSRISKIVTTSKWLDSEDEEGDRVNTNDYQNRRKTNAQDLINTLTTDETKEQIQTYTSNTTRVSKLTEVRQNLERLAIRLKEHADEENLAITAINKEVETSDLSISQIDIATQEAEITAIKAWALEEINTVKAASADIENQLREKGIKGDLAGILGKIEDYQKIISDAEAKLELIESRREDLATAWSELFESATPLSERLEAERTSINTMFQEKLDGSAGALPEHQDLVQRLLCHVSIEGQSDFNRDQFHVMLTEFLDGRKFRSRSIRTSFPISSVAEFLSLIRNEKVINVGGEGDAPIDLQTFAENKDLFREGSSSSEFLGLFFLEENRRKYLRVIPRILYHGKSPDQLSVGQRGTLYVSMKLATDLFTPFVFDQPEDDLDNEFIMEELRPIFEEIKRYRQVIIATHNANLVVNADAEQVIVAHNESEVLSYTSGALEHTSGDYADPGTRENVCRILEGGEEAFRQRERKYGMAD